jgi:serine/threonine-protein kinase HipA
VDGRALLRWTIFQLLIGNSDAHGKNLSFFVDHGGLRMAPAYDLVCLPPLGFSTGHAMAIGDAFEPAEVTALEWAAFAMACDVAPRSLALELRRMCERVSVEAERLAKSLDAEVPPAISAGILAVIIPICQRQSALAPMIPKIDRGLL